MTVTITIRRQWVRQETMFLVGPGGVGKSSLGNLLAPRWGWGLIDLDIVFCERIGTIGPYIATHGYEAYRAANIELAETLFAGKGQARIFVTSSGFLAAPEGSVDRRRAQALLRGGYAVTLLPSLDLERATGIVVERQINRPFGLKLESEADKFRARFETCRDAADLLVVSEARSEVIAGAVAGALGMP